MRIGLAYDLKSAVAVAPHSPEDESEEYDPPDTIDALASEIENLGHEVSRLGGGAEFLDRIRGSNVDLVFNIAEGRGVHRSRESQVPAVLEMLGIPYSGSDPLTLALCLDKPLAKQIALAAGVSTPGFAVIRRADDLDRLVNGTFEFPVVVKPSFEGSSKGIRLNSRVERKAELHKRVAGVLKDYRQPVLVEEFVRGKEITVGVVGNDPPGVIAMMEVVPTDGREDDFMYTLEVKRDWQSLVSYRCPPKLPSRCLRDIEEAALALFNAFQCRDVARLDFRVDGNGTPQFLEANPLPGFSPVYSDLPIMARLSGWEYRRLVGAVLNAALARYGLR